MPRSPASTGAPAITIIGAAASGCPKELYEPLWDALFEYASTTTAFSIRGIWIADVYFQGQSGLLNAEHLGNERR